MLVAAAVAGVAPSSVKRKTADCRLLVTAAEPEKRRSGALLQSTVSDEEDADLSLQRR